MTRIGPRTNAKFRTRLTREWSRACIILSPVMYRFSLSLSLSDRLPFRCFAWQRGNWLKEPKHRATAGLPKSFYSVTIKCILNVRGLSHTSFSSLIPFLGRPWITNRNWSGSFNRLRKWSAHIPCSFTISKWLSLLPFTIVYSIFSSWK